MNSFSTESSTSLSPKLSRDYYMKHVTNEFCIACPKGKKYESYIWGDCVSWWLYYCTRFLIKVKTYIALFCFTLLVCCILGLLSCCGYRDDSCDTHVKKDPPIEIIDCYRKDEHICDHPCQPPPNYHVNQLSHLQLLKQEGVINRKHPYTKHGGYTNVIVDDLQESDPFDVNTLYYANGVDNNNDQKSEENNIVMMIEKEE